MQGAGEMASPWCVRMIALGDKLANVRAMCRDYMVIFYHYP